MKKLGVVVAVVVTIIVTVLGARYAIDEREKEMQNRIYELEASLDYVVDVRNFIEFTEGEYGDFSIRARAVVLPFDYVMWMYECHDVNGYVISDAGVDNRYDHEAYDRINRSWYGALREVIEMEDGWA